MTTLTTHTLNSVNGTHAAGVRVALYRIDSSGKRTTLFGADTPVPPQSILREAVFRFTMPDPHGACHIPLMMAPNSYLLWCSSL